MDWLWGFFVPVALWIVDKAFGGHVKGFLEAGLRRRLPRQPVIMPVDKRAFDEGDAVIRKHFPSNLRFPKSTIAAWLDGPSGGPWKNFYFVARDRDRQVRGVIHATVYPMPDQLADQCLVMYFTVSPDTTGGDAMAKELWSELEMAAEEFTSRPECRYYSVFLPKNDGIETAENEKRQLHRRLLGDMGFRAFDADVSIPDVSMSNRRETLLDRSSSLRARLAYFGRPASLSEPSFDEALRFVYEMDYWWGLTWGIPDLSGSMTLATLLRDLRSASHEEGDGPVELVDIA